MSEPTRRCCHCKKIKLLTEFNKDNRTLGLNGFCRVCRDCSKERSNAHYQKNKKHIKEITKKRHRRLRLDPAYREIERRRYIQNSIKQYGLTLEQFDAMFEAQKGVCAICGKPQMMAHGKTGVLFRLFIDHNHETGKIRGLLCGHCNLDLHVVENEDFCKEAKKYLRRF